MISRQQFASYQRDPAKFRDDLLIDKDGQPVRFGSCMDEWQRADFSGIDPALQACCGCAPKARKQSRFKVKGKPPKVRNRVYLERPRGHSKTTDLAVTVCYAMAFAKRPIKAFAFAADKEQASLLKQQVQTICRLNPWLGNILDIQRHSVVNKAAGHAGEGGTLEIQTSDVASSFGILPDLIIADELTHWLGDGSLWHSLISSAAKRSHCLLCVISNAGFQDSWQWNVREAARTDPNWIFSRLDGPVASWLTEERLDEQSRMLPSIAYMRLWDNIWTTGGGDALSEDVINAAFIPDLTPQTGPDPEYHYVAGMDLGVSRDASAICVLGIRSGEHSHGRIRLAATRIWKPTKGTKVDLTDVERELVRLHHVFGFHQIRFDPWQSLHMASRLASMNFVKHVSRSSEPTYAALPMYEVPSTGNNLQKMATVLIEAFNDGRIELYAEPNLKRDLFRLRVEELSYGFRLTSPRDETGHGDMASAFQLALLAAQDIAQHPPASFGKFLGAAKWSDFDGQKSPSRMDLILKDLHANGWSERSMNQAAAFLSSTNTFR